jgi:transcriptional regulator with XRE-family HTH domain
MPAKRASSKDTPIGDRLRTQRIDVLNRGLREMAGLIDVAPAHLTDIEKGRRTPSEPLLLRIADHYGIAEAELRAAWGKADAVVGEVATQDATTATKVPEFLRTARNLSPEQWDKIIGEARNMTSRKRKRGGS